MEEDTLTVNPPRWRGRRWLSWALALLALAWLSSAFHLVPETAQGVVTRFGRPLPGLAGPGLHTKAPWPVDQVVLLDRRLLIFDNEPTEMLTRDKKNVVVDSFVAWRIREPLRFVQTLRGRAEAEARLLDLVSSELGAAVGSEPMESFLAAGGAAGGLARVAALAEGPVAQAALSSFGIEVVDLEINGFSLPRQNRASVIDRMRSERARLATAYRSEGEERALKIEAEAAAERERTLAEARGRAEALRGGGEAEALALTLSAYRQDPALYQFLRSLESAEQVIDENTTLVLESSSELVKTVIDGQH